MYKIYKFTNQINGKAYIGLTKNSIEERLAGHLKVSQQKKITSKTNTFQYAIIKYGIENFKSEILIEVETLEEANDAEIAMIAKYNTFKGDGYNETEGGYSTSHFITLTREYIEEVLNFYLAGISIKDIASKYKNTSKGSIHDITRGRFKTAIDANLWSKVLYKKLNAPKKKRMNQDVFEKIVDDYISGLTIAQCQKKHKYTDIFALLNRTSNKNLTISNSKLQKLLKCQKERGWKEKFT